MTYTDFFNAVGKNRILPVYFFAGEEQYIMKQALRQLSEKLLPEGFEALNETVIEGGTATEIISVALTLPLMCERRLVVVRDYGPLTGGVIQNESEEVDRMLEWFKNPADTACVVFTVKALAERRRASKDGDEKRAAKKDGRFSDALKKSAGFVAFGALNDADKASWCHKEFEKYEKRADRGAVQRLTLYAGQSLTGLAQEIAKLSAFAGDRVDITAQDVEAIVTPSTEYTVFAMIDALIDGRALEARRWLASLLLRGENHVGLMAMLTRQFRIMAHIRMMRDAGKRQEEMLADMKLAEFAFNSINRHVGKFTTDQLKAHYRACVDDEFSVKNGKMTAEMALDNMMMRLERRIGTP